MHSEKDIARFHSQTTRLAEWGCILWLGGLNQSGYGQFFHSKKTVRAHRFAYEVAKGPIPDGLTIDHLCRVRRCVNPDHMEAVTIAENTLRAGTFIGRNAQKINCPRGHLLQKRYETNRRWCRICFNHYMRLKKKLQAGKP